MSFDTSRSSIDELLRLGNLDSDLDINRRFIEGYERANAAKLEERGDPVCPCGHHFFDHVDAGWCQLCYWLLQPPCSGVAAIDNTATPVGDASQ